MEAFDFNGDYKDASQVKHLYDEYCVVFERVRRGDRDFAYNDDFKGEIYGLAGADSKNEDTAIYLLQGLRGTVRGAERVAALRGEGFMRIESMPDGQHRFDEIAIVDCFDSIKRYPSSRLIVEDGRVRGVLPKGRRTRGRVFSGANGVPERVYVAQAR